MKLILVLLTTCSAWADVHVSDDNSAFDAGLKQWRLMIPGDTITAPGHVFGFDNDVRISDIGTLKRTGQTTSYSEGNNLRFVGNFGFNQLKVEDVTLRNQDGQLVTLGGVKLDKAIITSSDNAFDVEYQALVQQVGCEMKWNKFQISKMNDVKVNGQDVTKEFGEKVLPSLNKHLAQPEFLQLMKEHMTPCKETPLRKLIWGA